MAHCFCCILVPDSIFDVNINTIKNFLRYKDDGGHIVFLKQDKVEGRKLN